MSSINKPATPWADTPFPLIATPGRGQDLTSIHSSIFIARDMACAHNALLRALNSIYNQCIYVSKTQDIIDLLTYTKFWIDWIHEHHQAEERMLFPDIERISGIKGWGEGNVSQHEAFLAGMERLEGFVKGFLGEGSNDAGGLKTGQKWNGIQMRVMIDGFAGDLTKHLRDEIDTLLALEPYDSMALRKAYDAFDLELRKGDKSVLFPMVLGAGDRSYEEGFEWPVVPSFVRVLVHYWFERKHRGVWRFSPSSSWGERKKLTFSE